MGIIPQNFEKENYEKDMEEWEGDKFSGVGIKRMKSYKCNFPINILNQLRESFWNSKLKDKNLYANWSKIKRAIELDEPRDLQYLKHFHIEPINGCINECKDIDGNIYKIPNYCINDPYYERIISHTNYNQIEENILKIRFYKYGCVSPLILELKNTITGKDLKEQYKEKEKLDDNVKIKMIISGVEIKDEENLYQHNLTEDKSIYVIIQ